MENIGSYSMFEGLLVSGKRSKLYSTKTYKFNKRNPLTILITQLFFIRKWLMFSTTDEERNFLFLKSSLAEEA